MSSHREAPEISKDPVADNTDTYAFVSPDRPDTVTIIANFIPLQLPNGGPNFYEFGEDVGYQIHVSNSGDSHTDIVYTFRFTTKVRNPDTFLYNTGQIKHIGDAAWNRPQFYSVTRTNRDGSRTVLGTNLPVPPVNVGPRSTPNYGGLAAEGVHSLPGGIKVFAGQRAESFHVDLGSIFDLGTLRPFESLHLIPSADAMGVNGSQGLNVHTIALQIPKTQLTVGAYNPTDVNDMRSVVGVWAGASRPRSRTYDNQGRITTAGKGVMVSRLANPLINEVIIAMGDKDRWNSQFPASDVQFLSYYQHPELANLLPVLYPGVFPHLAAYTKKRSDIIAILLTGIPAGIVPGFQNYTGPTPADLLRLNMAVKPTKDPNPLGVVGGDLAGFPNGRRPVDDVVTIEVRALAGLTIPLVDPTYTPDAAASGVADGTTYKGPKFLSAFPYLGLPISGYNYVPGRGVA